MEISNTYIYISILVGVITTAVIATLFFKKSKDFSKQEGCGCFMWIVLLGVILGAITLAILRPKNVVTIHEIVDENTIITKKYSGSYTTPNGVTITYEEQKDKPHSWYVLNNTSKPLLKVTSSYGEHKYNFRDYISIVADPYELVELGSEPDFKLQYTPGSVAVRSRGSSSIKSASRTAIFFESQIPYVDYEIHPKIDIDKLNLPNHHVRVEDEIDSIN